MIYTLTLNPAVDRTLTIPGFALGAVNRVACAHTAAGGKGVNVARAVRALGAECLALGVAGGDTGAFLLRTLTDEGIRHDFVRVAAPTRTNLKVIDPEKGETTDINEPGQEIPAPALEEALARAHARTQAGDWMAVSGRLPPGVPAERMAHWMQALAGRGVRVCLDAAGTLLRAGLAVPPYLIKPNAQEFRELTGCGDLDALAVAAAARPLAAAGTRVAVSLGERGVVYAGPEGAYAVPAVPVAAFSTVGAGDTLLAALMAGMAGGWPVARTLRTAVALAAACVKRAPGGALDAAWARRVAQTVPVRRLDAAE